MPKNGALITFSVYVEFLCIKLNFIKDNYINYAGWSPFVDN